MRGLGGLLVLTIVLAIQLSPLRSGLSGEGLDRARHATAALETLGPSAFLALCAVGIGIGLPRLGFAALAGMAFGWLPGCVLAQLGTIAGCFFSFSGARYFGRDLASRSRARPWTAIAEQVARRPIASNVALRLVPVGNSLVLNSVLGVCPISSRDFLIGTAIGTFPSTLAFALFGSGISGAAGTELALGAVLAVAIGSFAAARHMRAEPDRP